MHSKNYRELLARYLLPYWPQIALTALLLGGDIALQLLNPQLLRIFIDDISNAGISAGLTGIAALFISVAILQQIVKIGATYVSERLGWNTTNALRVDLTRHLLYLDMSFYKKHTPGSLIERVDGDITAMANFFSQFVVKVLGNLLLLAGILVVLLLQDWRIGLAFTGMTLLSLLVILSVRNVAVGSWKTFRQASADLYGFLEERITGTEDIRASGAHAYILNRFYHYARTRLRTARKARLLSAIVWCSPMIPTGIATVASFVLILWFYQAGAMTLGMAFLIYFYTRLIFQPLDTLTEQLDDFQKANAGFVRINELMRVTSELEDGPGVDFSSNSLTIEFDHVSFGYGEEEMVVRDLTFTLAPGEVLGLLGRTGSGKTTITRLLSRMYDPAQGTIRLAGHDLRQACLADLRSTIGMVTQNVQLFHASIRDNLTFFDSTITDEHILEALNTLGLQGWLKRQPDGLDTLLAASGGGLSAGEAQLLAFARVFLKDPAIVVLDEASSRLDPVTESLLERAIDRLLAGRTAVIIAHRLSTVSRADTIMVLEDGQICEYGPRAQLASDDNSRFSYLLHTAHEEVLQ